MRLSDQYKQILINECIFTSSRSSGPGGQNVNKVNTKIQLRFDIANSTVFREDQKVTIKSRLIHRITLDGILQLTIQETRSQLKNKQIAINKLFELIEKALTPPKKRLKTKPTRASKIRRIEDKKKQSGKKQDRRNPIF